MVCIVNPHSAGGQTAARWPALARRLESEGFAFDTLTTRAPGDGSTLAREALARGATTVVAVGGDGTIHEVVNGFFGESGPLNPQARLGILPQGSGSDLIKTLGIPSDEAGAIARLRRDEAHAIDLGRVSFVNHQGQPETRYYINTASAGMTGAVLAKMRELPGFLGGSLAYMAASLLTLGTFKAFPCTLVLDDEPPSERKALMVVIGNGRYFGGGMHVLPNAQPDDGWLDVLLLKETPLLELLLAFPRIYAGTHLKLPIVETVRAKRVSITGPQPLLLEIDGEQPGVSPASFELLPQALRVIR